MKLYIINIITIIIVKVRDCLNIELTACSSLNCSKNNFSTQKVEHQETEMIAK